MQSKRWLSALVPLVLLIFLCGSSLAADQKIAVIEINKILATCDKGDEIKARLNDKKKELQEKFKADEEKLKELQTEIKKKSSAWSEAKKKEKVGEFQKSARELQLRSQEATNELRKMEQAELAPILKELETIVTAYGKEKGYSAILDVRAGVVYSDDSIQITDIILKKLNKAMAKQ